MRAVIKMGGELLEEGERGDLLRVADDVRTLLGRGHHVVFVHGGGPQATALQKALGQEPTIIGGRRVTDARALDVIKMVIGGKLNIDFCSFLRAHGINAFGLNGVSGGAISCVRRPPRVVSGGGSDPIDFGYVGDVEGVNRELLSGLIEQGYAPVLACIGSDAGGQVYNINADAVASRVACGIDADHLLMITGVGGVLRDLGDPSSRIARMTAVDARRAIEEGVVKGGMIPKLEESISALERGVREVQILGGLGAGDLLRAIETPGAVGTVLVPGP